jgi:hypothetical protein
VRRTAVAERPATAGFDEIFDAFLCTGTPVLLRGAALDWPARTRWTPELLVAGYGDAIVDFSNTRSGERVERRLAEYFSLNEDERPQWYLTDWDFRRRHPELLDDIRVPPLFAVDWVPAMPSAHRPELLWVYAGHAGTRGPVHRDNYGTSAWLAVLQGVKQMVFPTPRNGESPAKLDFFTEPEAAFDTVAELAVCTLEAGDVVYVPAGRWHAAFNPEYCLSVTANFVDGANFCRHRDFATRHWYGQRMLTRALDELRGMPPGAERHRLRRHLAEALERYRRALEHETSDVAALASRLAGEE